MLEGLSALYDVMMNIASVTIDYMKRAARTTRDVFRAHYNLVGKYTAPIEQELLSNKPPRVTKIPILPQLALFFIPPIAILLSLSIVPLFYNSVYMVIRSYIGLLNLPLADLPERKIDNIIATSYLRTLYGLPGLLLGSFAGTLSVIAVSTVRMITNFFPSLYHTVGSLSDLALVDSENHHLDWGLTKTERTFLQKYVFGIFGIAAGIVPGVLAFTAVLSIRIIYHSTLSFFRTCASAANLVLAQNREFEDVLTNDENRTAFQTYVLGLPGLIFGIAASTINIPFFASLRLAEESWYSFVESLQYAYSLDFFKESETLEFNQRHKKERFGFGLPGILLGVGAGGALVTLTHAFQIIDQSVETFGFMVAYGLNLITFQEPKEHDPEERSNILFYVAGGPGFLLAALPLALAYYIIYPIEHLILQSAYSTSETFNRIINFAQSKNNDELVTERTASQRLLGAPGILVGAAASIPFFLLIGAARSVVNSGKSFLKLSLAMVNVAIEYRYFQGLVSDKRPTSSKYLGIPGYALAVIVALPTSTVIFGLRKLPIALSFVFAISVSPLVAAIKGLSLALLPSRFADQGKIPDNYFQNIKDIYSSLDANGRLPVGRSIETGQTGGKGVKAFMRKTITVNTPTLTEKFLDIFLEKYRTDGWIGDSIEHAKKETQKIYSHLECLESQSEIDQRNQHIENLAQFVNNRVIDSGRSVPDDLYTKSEKNWSAIFWGKENRSGYTQAPENQHTP